MGAISYRIKGYGMRRNKNWEARKDSAAGWFGKSRRIPVVKSGLLRDHAQNVRSRRIWDGNSWLRRSNGRKTRRRGHPFCPVPPRQIDLAGEPIRRMSIGLRAFSSVQSRFARANPRMVDAKRGPSWRPSISRGAEEL